MAVCLQSISNSAGSVPTDRSQQRVFDLPIYISFCRRRSPAFSWNRLAQRLRGKEAMEHPNQSVTRENPFYDVGHSYNATFLPLPTQPPSQVEQRRP